MATKDVWWALDPSVWDAGSPRRLKSRPSSIPETERACANGQPRPQVEVEAVARVKQSAIRSQGLVLRQLLSRDRWFDRFAPEVPAAVRFKRIAEEHEMTIEQVTRALQLAHELAADGLL